jgi:hypothetical protein
MADLDKSASETGASGGPVGQQAAHRDRGLRPFSRSLRAGGHRIAPDVTPGDWAPLMRLRAFGIADGVRVST